MSAIWSLLRNDKDMFRSMSGSRGSSLLKDHSSKEPFSSKFSWESSERRPSLLSSAKELSKSISLTGNSSLNQSSKQARPSFFDKNHSSRLVERPPWTLLSSKTNSFKERLYTTTNHVSSTTPSGPGLTSSLDLHSSMAMKKLLTKASTSLKAAEEKKQRSSKIKVIDLRPGRTSPKKATKIEQVGTDHSLLKSLKSSMDRNSGSAWQEI